MYVNVYQRVYQIGFNIRVQHASMLQPYLKHLETKFRNLWYGIVIKNKTGRLQERKEYDALTKIEPWNSDMGI